MAQPATTSPKPVAGTEVKDAIDHLRSSAQELHKAISDAAAKRSGATKADLATLTEKAKTVAQSAKASVKAEQGKVAKQLTDAVQALWQLDDGADITLHGTGVVHRDGLGYVQVDTKETHPALGTARGVGIGALLGALAGPAGAAVGAAGGAGIGAATGGTVGL